MTYPFNLYVVESEEDLEYTNHVPSNEGFVILGLSLNQILLLQRGLHKFELEAMMASDDKLVGDIKKIGFGLTLYRDALTGREDGRYHELPGDTREVSP